MQQSVDLALDFGDYLQRSGAGKPCPSRSPIQTLDLVSEDNTCNDVIGRKQDFKWIALYL